MTRHVAPLLLAVGLLSPLPSCRPRTWVGGTVYFPPGATAEAAEYRLAINVEGVPGRAYVDRTEKHVHVTVWRGKRSLLERDYRIVATALDWEVTWRRIDDLEIVLVEGPEGVPVYPGVPSELREVLALKFAYDTTAQAFREPVVMPKKVDQ